MKTPQLKPIVLALAIAATITLTGCTSINPYTGESQVNNTTKGALIGGGAGAGIGALAGGSTGALIGAGVGTAVGSLAGFSIDRENEELRQVLVGTGVQVQKNGREIVLVMSSDVSFRTNSADINAGFYPALNSVAIVLRKYSSQNVVITGYTDNTGSPTYNQDLSARRAESVGAYLVGQGISSNKLFTKGMGELNPIASNATASGRAQNRRVEITLRPQG